MSGVNEDAGESRFDGGDTKMDLGGGKCIFSSSSISCLVSRSPVCTEEVALFLLILIAQVETHLSNCISAMNICYFLANFNIYMGLSPIFRECELAHRP